MNIVKDESIYSKKKGYRVKKILSIFLAILMCFICSSCGEKESIEVKNNADQVIYQTEKALEELGDKVSAEDKAKITAKSDALKAVKDGEDIEAIKKAMDELNQEFYAISSKLYADAGAQPGAEGFDPNNMGGANAGAGAAHDDNVVDADFEVKEDK